jgi:hypothetical protein
VELRMSAEDRRFVPFDADVDKVEIGDVAPMTAEQASRLRTLSEQAFELEAFAPNLTRAEAALRIATLEAKLRLQDEPPHTL